MNTWRRGKNGMGVLLMLLLLLLLLMMMMMMLMLMLMMLMVVRGHVQLTEGVVVWEKRMSRAGVEAPKPGEG